MVAALPRKDLIRKFRALGYSGPFSGGKHQFMIKGRSTLSKAKSYKEIGDFWDAHDLSDFWDQTKKVEFEVDIKSEITYYSLDKSFPSKFSLLHREAAYLLIRLLIYGFKRSFKNRTDESSFF